MRVGYEFPLTPAGSRKLREAIRTPIHYGGWSVFYTEDGGALCAGCVRENYREIAAERRDGICTGWLVRWWGSSEWIEDPTPCDHCGVELSPYVEDGVDG